MVLRVKRETKPRREKMKKVYSLKKLYDPKFPIMFFTSRKKALESAEATLQILSDQVSPKYDHRDVGSMMTYVSIQVKGMSQSLIVEQHIVH